jgi:hypothetical protein
MSILKSTPQNTAMLTIMVLFFAGTLNAQNYRFPSLTVSPKAQEYHERLAGNNVHWRDLAEAALWASLINAGIGAERRATGYLEKIDAAATELYTAVELPQDIKERGAYVLGFVHRKFLKNYSENQTRLDEILASGRYNCVSSAVLYMVLGLSVNLDIGGVVTKDHAFITVNTGTERIDVETTNRYGFNPGSRREFQDSFGSITGFVYVPATNYRERAATSPAELVSLILRNRIAILEKQNRFAESIPLAINREVFLSGNLRSIGVVDPIKAEFLGDPKNDVMNRLFNFGTDLLNRGREDEVIAWAEYASEYFPDPAAWQELVKTAANNKLVRLIRAKKISEARSALMALQPKLNNENYLALYSMVIEAEAVEKTNAIRRPGDAETALAFLAQVWERLSSERRDEIRTAAIINEANRLERARDYAGGMRWLSSAVIRYGSNALIEKALQTMRANRVGQLHNEFAALYNRRNYTGARASIQRSLEEFPGERQLIQDLNLVERALQQ